MVIQVVAALSFLVTTDPTKDPAKRDLEKLQGTWVLVGAEEKGRVIPEEAARREGESVLIKGDRLTMTRKGRTRGTGIIRLDPGKKPAWMDLLDPDDKNKVIHGIYKLEGDRLTLCVSHKFRANRKEDRPAKFTTKREVNKDLPGLVLGIYHRQKK